MKLSEQDAKQFYSLFIPLLDFVNEKYSIVDQPQMEGAADGSIDPNKSVKISERLWQETDLLDEYVAMHPEFPEEDKEILLSWKRCVTGKFMLERILKKGAILVEADYNDAYLVSGIVSDWEDLVPWSLPIMLSTTLIPFKGRIIYDSTFFTYPLQFGGGVRRTLRETYSELRKAGRVHSTL